MTEKRKRQKPGDEHYVNNREFTLALDKYARESQEAIKNGQEKPVMPRYIADCIIKMSFRLSLTPRFVGYHYRDEMVQNAILAAVKYAHRFDGNRFDNGFAYITQILFSHMIITIKNEKKRYKTNLELIQQAVATNVDNPEFAEYIEEHARDIADQKLSEMAKASDGVKGGFVLRTGWTKESREAYAGGKALVREDEEVEIIEHLDIEDFEEDKDLNS